MKPSSHVGRCLVQWSLPLLARVGSACQSTILGSGLGAQSWAAEPWGSKPSLKPTSLESGPNNCPTTSIVEPLAGPQERHPAAAKRRTHRTRAVASHQIPEHEAGVDHPSTACARGASLGRPRVPSGSSSDNEHGSALPQYTVPRAARTVRSMCEVRCRHLHALQTPRGSEGAHQESRVLCKRDAILESAPLSACSPRGAEGTGDPSRHQPRVCRLPAGRGGQPFSRFPSHDHRGRRAGPGLLIAIPRGLLLAECNGTRAAVRSGLRLSTRWVIRSRQWSSAPSESFLAHPARPMPSRVLAVTVPRFGMAMP